MDRRLTGPLLAEGLGTFLFFVVGAGSVVVQGYPGASGGSGLVGVALAHGLVLAVLVSALGAVSGGHFNPAVTFGVWICGRMDGARALAYVVAQLVGALAAGIVLRLVFDPSLDETKLGTPALGEAVGPVAGIAVEAILTMVLLTAVFGTAIDPRAPKIGGLAIGLAVAADILFGGPLTGAAMNPARWFGPAVASGTFDDWYVWWIGPLIGAGVVAAIYRSVFLHEADLARTPASPE
ncbi:MAG TPA: aquaporin [Candidatus Limnocylindrales bacterium]|jgi:MIP family channel proteins|nr:aquaporin [Candidatus Limnocylindrales bacterium]